MTQPLPTYTRITYLVPMAELYGCFNVYALYDDHWGDFDSKGLVDISFGDIVVDQCFKKEMEQHDLTQGIDVILSHSPKPVWNMAKATKSDYAVEMQIHLDFVNSSDAIKFKLSHTKYKSL